MKWITLEEGHVAGVPDPPGRSARGLGADLMALLRDGVIDAAIVDRVAEGERVLPVVPDPDAACRDWQQPSRRAERSITSSSCANQ